MLSRIITRRIHIHSSLASTEDRQTIIKDLLDNAATFKDLKPATQEDTWSTLPYAEGTVFTKNREQSIHAYRPKTDPRETSIIMFPGQGAQYVGMAKNILKFPGARDIFALANEVLKYDLLKLCLEGPKEKLNEIIYAQPAVMVTSLAALEKLKEERPNAIEKCIATAGFGSGEITALVFAGALPFDKALRLIQVRAEAMRLAAESQSGGMATVIYGPNTSISKAIDRAIDWCRDKGIENPQCSVANYLYPHSKVIAGHTEALEYLEANIEHFKLKKVKRIPVEGAFHTDLMESAVEPFTKALRKITIEDPLISVHSNVDGKRYRNAGHILKQLPKQIVRPIKWEQILHILYGRKQGEHFPRTFECGPGKGLTSILQQVNAKAWDSSFNIN